MWLRESSSTNSAPGMPAASNRPSATGITSSPLAWVPCCGKRRLDVDGRPRAIEARKDFAGRGLQAQVVEPLQLFRRAAGDEARREDLPERRIVFAPAHAREIDHRPQSIGGAPGVAPIGSARITAI